MDVLLKLAWISLVFIFSFGFVLKADNKADIFWIQENCKAVLFNYFLSLLWVTNSVNCYFFTGNVSNPLKSI